METLGSRRLGEGGGVVMVVLFVLEGCVVSECGVQAAGVVPVHPFRGGAPQRLGVHAQLVADALDRPCLGGRILPGLDRHPRGSLPQFVRILPWCCHDSDPLSGDQSLQPSQDASMCCQVELRVLQR